MQQFTHSFKRRMRGHNYHAPCVYHITISKSDDCPRFGTVAGSHLIPYGQPDAAHIENSELGEIIESEIWKISKFHPEIKVLQYVVMPDHLHLLLQVTEPTEKALGYYIANLKSGVRRSLQFRHPNSPEFTIFEEGYNDRILFHWRSLETVVEYIRSNPYRLAVRQAIPDFFRRISGLEIGGGEWQAYGNTFLLQNPFKEAVIVHRRYTEQENEQLREKWLYTAAGGGVLVSPFISLAEKAIRQEAISLGARIIQIVEKPFGEKYKPSGADFDLCAAGRMLIVAPKEEHGIQGFRGVCLWMNRIAELIAAGEVKNTH